MSKKANDEMCGSVATSGLTALKASTSLRPWSFTATRVGDTGRHLLLPLGPNTDTATAINRCSSLQPLVRNTLRRVTMLIWRVLAGTAGDRPRVALDTCAPLNATVTIIIYLV